MKDNLLVYKGKTKTTYYAQMYVNGVRKKINLGHDLPAALLQLRALEETNGRPQVKTLRSIWEHYTKSDKGLLARPISTQKDYALCWRMIEGVMGDLKLESINPSHIKQYLGHRSAPVRANREKALISILFNHARNYCNYDGQNPTLGIKSNPETGRTKYVEKWEYEQIYTCADTTLKNVMDLLLYTGQRVSDVLDFKVSDIRKNVDLTRIRMSNGIPTSDITGKDFADCLELCTNKTAKKISIVIEGELETTINRIMEQRKKQVINSMYLICNHHGQRLSRHALTDKFKRARAKAGFKPYEIQLRDLRSKNASDDTLEAANTRLAHTTTTMTERYRNKVRSVTVRPLDKLI